MSSRTIGRRRRVERLYGRVLGWGFGAAKARRGLGRRVGDQIVGKRADANFFGLRLISGTIEGHAPRGVLSTGAGEAQDSCKL